MILRVSIFLQMDDRGWHHILGTRILCGRVRMLLIVFGILGTWHQWSDCLVLEPISSFCVFLLVKLLLGSKDRLRSMASFPLFMYCDYFGLVFFFTLFLRSILSAKVFLCYSSFCFFVLLEICVILFSFWFFVGICVIGGRVFE